MPIRSNRTRPNRTRPKWNDRFVNGRPSTSLARTAIRRSARQRVGAAVGAITLLAITLPTIEPLHADDLSGNSAAVDALEAAAGSLTNHRYQLKYKLRTGQTLHYKVVHQALVKTSVQGEQQTSESRSTSGKSWRISSRDDNGNPILTNVIDYIDMWSRTGDQAPIQFDSRKGQAPPAEYSRVAEMIDIPLSEITIASTGKILDRNDHVPQHDMGTGGITVPFPETAIKTGDQWSTPAVVQVRNSEGVRRAIKTRQLYRLTKVETGVATIDLRTEILTAVDDPRIEAQLVQKLANGEVKFDIDAGVILSRTLNWNSTVVSFNGPESNMSYTARLTETLENARVASK